MNRHQKTSCQSQKSLLLPTEIFMFTHIIYIYYKYTSIHIYTMFFEMHNQYMAGLAPSDVSEPRTSGRSSLPWSFAKWRPLSSKVSWDDKRPEFCISQWFFSLNICGLPEYYWEYISWEDMVYHSIHNISWGNSQIAMITSGYVWWLTNEWDDWRWFLATWEYTIYINLPEWWKIHVSWGCKWW